VTRLSEFMRLGAMATPQAFGAFRDKDGGTCGMGAAFIAAGCRIIPADTPGIGEEISVRPGTAKTLLTFVAPNEWIPVLSLESFCPDCGLVLPVPQLIAHLNDDHRWTRTRQADFVEALERKQETPREEKAEVLA
jgi:hypothetical protein